MRQELQVPSQGGLGLQSHRRPRHLCPAPPPCTWLSVSRSPHGSDCCQSPSHHTSVQEAEKKKCKGQGVLFPGESATFKELSQSSAQHFYSHLLGQTFVIWPHTAARNIGIRGPERISGLARMVRAQKPGMGEPCGASLPPQPIRERGQGPG